jgi:exonuclease VII small subunit
LDELDEFQAKMEEGIVALKNIPPDFCKHMEKAREKERRLKFREENIETLLKEQEDRRIRSLERARVTTQSCDLLVCLFLLK